MPIATLDKVSLAYGHVPLLDAVELALEPGDRLALIGRNGTGKSTLLKVLAGEVAADEGQVWRRAGLAVAYVPQEPILDPELTVFEAAAEGLGETRDLLTAYDAAAHAMERGEAGAIDDLERIGHQIDDAGGWLLKSRVDAAVSRSNLNPHAMVSELSGGQRKRLALARALVAEPELLLLDEPTNHLDVTTIEWLEELLRGFNGALLFVTHDRVFLDRVANAIVELDRGHLTHFPERYAAYRARKAQQASAEEFAQEKFDKLLEQEEAWIRRGVEARRTRDEGRVRRLEALRKERAARRDRVGTVNFALDAGTRSGKLVTELTDVSKSFGDNVVVRDFTCRVLRGDKVGLIGPNGAGKTTLIRMILGELAPDSGEVRQGTKLNVAYFDQFRNQLDEEATVLDSVSDGSDFVEVGGSRKHVISYLGEFLFAPARVRSPVKSLSGGERNRLLLARLFAKPANLLVLDEPTNDLDLETLELLESLLQEYDGTVLLVSHDRAFLDNVVTQVIAFDGDGRWVENPGGYDEWARVLRSRDQRDASASAAPGRAPAGRAPRPPAKLSFKETQELEVLPARIEELEREQAQLENEMADPQLYRSEAERVRMARARHIQVEQELVEMMARWEELEARQRA